MKKKNSLILTCIVLLLVMLGCSNASPQLESQPDSSATATPLEISRVGIGESKAAFDNSEAVFVDVRSKSSYDAGHIPGALFIPLVDIETRMRELDPNHWIITYCT